VDRGSGGEIDDRVAAGEARRLLRHAVGAGHHIQQPPTTPDRLRAGLPMALRA
jgi:hypothetical protein